MPVKKCKICENVLPLATKTCTCGYNFKKKPKDTDNVGDETHNDVEIDETTIDAEEFFAFKGVQDDINDRFDETLASIVSTQNDNCKEMNEIRQEIKQEVKELKEFTVNKLQELKEEIESCLNRRLCKQDDKINEMQKKMISMEKRLSDIENNDSSSSSEDEEEEKTENGERGTPTVPTSNRFNPLTKETEPPTASTAEQSQGNQNEFRDNERFNIGNEIANKIDVSGGILILSDSTMKRIIENKITQNTPIRKEYVRGGTENMADFIESFQDPTQYNQIIIHTGTNDIQKLTIDEIIVNIKIIIEKCKFKWPNATITLSGVTHHKRDLAKNDMIDVLNEALKQLTNRLDNKLRFMNNNFITRKKNGDIDHQVYFDDIHLNTENGIRKLAANIKNHLGLRQRNQQRARRRNHNVNDNFQHGFDRKYEYQQRSTRDRRPFFDSRTNFNRHTRPTQYYDQDGPQNLRQRRTSPAGIENALKTLAEWINYYN